MIESLFKAIRAIRDEVEARRQLRDLLQKDDRLLRDVGVTRADVEIALAKPFRVPAWEEARRLSRQSLILDRAI
ncbi:MAG: DUF1127 domain-containing protein [Pseudomonadota bacterium]